MLSDRVRIIVIDANKLQLGALVHLQAGHPFRGAIEGEVDGDVLVLQMKDVDPASGIDWPGAIRTSLAGRKHPDWLQTGDVLFVAKGARFYAVCLDTPPGPAVCSPSLFHLRVKAPGLAEPAFLAWQMNQPPFQRQLQQAAEGSGQLSIRRPVLEALTLSVPSIAHQRRIVGLAELARQERHAFHQLVRNRELQLHALAEGLSRAALQEPK